jgi:hypothetical protein
MAKKCDKCLRGVQTRTTGTNPKDVTLKMDMGGAVVYVLPPHTDGTIDVTLNAESLLDGDYAVCIWNGEEWIIYLNLRFSLLGTL